MKRKVISIILVLAMLLSALPLSTFAAQNKDSTTTVELLVGETKQYKSHGWKSVWTSDNKEVATVTPDGKIKAVSAGTATVKEKYWSLFETVFGGKGSTDEYTVIVSEIEPEHITVGDTVKLHAKGAYAVWCSTNKKTATVSCKGNVTAVAPGNVTIKAISIVGPLAFAKVGKKVVEKFEFVVDAAGDEPDDPIIPDDPVDPNQCKVEFVSHDGIIISTQIIEKGGFAEIPEEPERDGFVFVAWYSDIECTQKFDFINTAINENIKLYALWIDTSDVLDSDADGIPDSVEKVYGINIGSADTDGDNLPDYTEISITNTDPTKSDTDNNGIPDGDEDNDKDELTNSAEIDIGTDPTLPDTDFDGLTDSEEINSYHTDPLNPDSDGDGIKDGDEVRLSLNPQSTDILKEIEQTLSEDLVPSALKEDNDAIPSISGYSDKYINECVSVLVCNEDYLNDNRAVVGKGIELLINGEEQFTLTFSTKKASGSLLIMRFDEEDGWVPEKTDIDGDKISAIVSKSGDYCVMDLDILLPLLGINVSEYYDEISALDQPLLVNRSVRSDKSFSIHTSSGTAKIMGQTDIVFAIDTTGSMSDEIYNVATNVSAFASELTTQYNVNANFALVDYKDIIEDGANSTVIVKNGTANWYTNVSAFSAAVSNLYVDGGGDTPETAVDALEVSRNLNYRKSVNKFIILVTDADYKNDNNYGISDLNEEISLLRNDGIVVCVVSPTEYQSLYQELYESTGGIYANIYGNFSEELLKLAEKIGSDVSEGNWILLDDYQFVSLDNPLSETSGDTDGDGVSDYNELSNPKKKDITTELKLSLLSLGANEKLIDKYLEECGGAFVYVYPYKSNPVMADTDGDGWIDSTDANPKEWDVGDRDLAMFAALSYENALNHIGDFYNVSKIKESEHWLDFASLKSMDSRLAKEWKIAHSCSVSSPIYVDNFDATTYINGNNIVIAYRGTNDGLWEWIDDAICYGLGNYHSEEAQTQAYALLIYNNLVKSNPKAKLYITGHSLGGYLAQIGASTLIMNKCDAKLARVSYFNGIGMKYNKLLFWEKNLEISALMQYGRTGLSPNGKLISYQIHGDFVSMLGTHYGDTIGLDATREAINFHSEKYGFNKSFTDGLLDLLSARGISLATGLDNLVNVPTIMYYYVVYGCSSVIEYCHVTHETVSFMYYLQQGTRTNAGSGGGGGAW